MSGTSIINPTLIAGASIPQKTATAASGAATCNGYLCRITSESLTTAAAAEYTLTLTNDRIAAGSTVLVSAAKGTSTQGTLVSGGVTPAAGSAVIVVSNVHASEALNGTIVIDVVVLNPAY